MGTRIFTSTWVFLTAYTTLFNDFLNAKKQQKPNMSKSNNTRRRRRKETYNIYIYKVLKQVHPEIGVSKKAMGILNSFVSDTFEKMATEAGRLCKYGKKQTMSARDIQSACKLILPGELAKHAVSEGGKAMKKYSSNS